MRRLLVYPALLAVLGFALAGCGERKAKTVAQHPLPPSPLVAQAEAGIPGGRFVMAAATSPRTFNPLYSVDAASDEIIRLLYASLVRIDAVTQEAGPSLAVSWSVAADQQTWTIKLREGVHWSDGRLFTADDVVFTWNDVMYNPGLNRATLEVFRVNGKNFEVSKIDDLAVRVVTPGVFAPFVDFFGTVPILPKHILEPAVKEGRFAAAYGAGTPPQRLVATGPYRVKEVQLGKSTLLERNPEYWVVDQRGRRLPYFDEVLINVDHQATDPTPFLAGKCDVFEFSRPDSFVQLKQPSRRTSFRVIELGLGTQRDFLWFNQNTGSNALGQPRVNPAKLKWFRNEKFRQAVSCGIDREALVRDVYGGHAQPVYGFFSSESGKWNNPNVPRYSYDPERARTLLAEIGIQKPNSDGVLTDAEGVPLEILFYFNLGNTLRERTASIIQEQLAKLGIKLICVPIDYRALVEKVNSTYDYECVLMGLGGGSTDPASQVNVLRSSEELHQWFPSQKTPSTPWEARIDTLMDEQMQTLDFSRRKKCFDEVQVILAEELPMIYTVSPVFSAAIRSDVGNVRPSALSPWHLTWNLEELYFTGQR